MKISIFSVGKAHESYIKEGVEQFTKRIAHYYPIDWQLITPSKLTEPNQIKKAEAASILKSLAVTDVLVLLDEKGKMLSSPGLAKLIQQKANQSAQRVIFLIGGAYGVDEAIQNHIIQNI